MRLEFSEKPKEMMRWGEMQHGQDLFTPLRLKPRIVQMMDDYGARLKPIGKTVVCQDGKVLAK